MQQSNITGRRVDGREAVGSKIKNVEILRFCFAWAIVGFHIACDNSFKEFGLGFLKTYTIFGGAAIGCFFILAFYFLIRGSSIKQPMLTFVCRKWLRLTPLIIVVSAFGYILHCCGYWKWDWAANIEQWFLVHDWSARTRWGQFVYPAWWCSAYMLASVTYIAMVRALPGRCVPLVLGILTVIAWRLEVCAPDHSKFRAILAFGHSTVAFFFLGMGALTVHIVRRIEKQPTLKSGGGIVTWVYTTAEVVLMGALLVRFFAASCIAWLNPLLISLCFSTIFVLFILKRGHLSRLLENDLSSFLGRYAYAIIIVHPLVLNCARAIILPNFRAEAAAHPWVVLGCIAGVTMLLAMAGYHLVERPIMRLCEKRLTGQDTISRETS